jgi:glycosyltransferase involved in cell wall biosynthesis
MATSARQPLRILSLLNTDWNPHFGAARVYMELMQQWHAAGHTVEQFSFSEAFPKKPVSPPQFALRRLLFPSKAAQFVRGNAERFDVIDALIGSLSAPRQKLGFTGLVVARSVGSHRLYDEFERSIPVRWPGSTSGTLLGRLFYSAVNRRLLVLSDAAIHNADLVNVPNTEEADFLTNRCGIERPMLVQPYGLTDEYRGALFSAAQSPADRLRQKRISFIGMWGPRKGSRIWGEIVRLVSRRIPEAEFCFLGTMVDRSAVLRDLGIRSSNRIQIIPEFSPAELPALLSTCAVAGFPSYVEGFGLAVLEQLAAGIPTIAFDQGGPRDILSENLPELLVPTGDIDRFADALVRALELELPEYERLVHASLQTVERFCWSQIAQQSAEQYRAALSTRSPS